MRNRSSLGAWLAVVLAAAAGIMAGPDEALDVYGGPEVNTYPPVTINEPQQFPPMVTMPVQGNTPGPYTAHDPRLVLPPTSQQVIHANYGVAFAQQRIA